MVPFFRFLLQPNFHMFKSGSIGDRIVCTFRFIKCVALALGAATVYMWLRSFYLLSVFIAIFTYFAGFFSSSSSLSLFAAASFIALWWAFTFIHRIATANNRQLNANEDNDRNRRRREKEREEDIAIWNGVSVWCLFLGFDNVVAEKTIKTFFCISIFKPKTQ